VTAATTLILCGWLGLQASRPFAKVAKSRADNDKIEQQVHLYELQNQRDQREIAAMHTKEGIEQAARKRGYIYPNEHRLRLPESSSQHL